MSKREFQTGLLELKEAGYTDDCKEVQELRDKYWDVRKKCHQRQRDIDSKLHEFAMKTMEGIGKRAEDSSIVTNAFVEMLIASYRQTGQGPRSSREQSQLRKDSISVYGSEEPQGGRLWCPITRAYLPSDEMVAAHIFPHKLGTKTMELVFGATQPNEIMSPRNCLIIAKAIEKRFDKHSLVIVPIQTKKGLPSRWKVRVLTDSQSDKVIPEINLSMDQLDDRELDFRTPYRPAARYLYYHFVMSVLFAKRGQEKGWVRRITSQENKLWATPGRYLRQSMLKRIALEIGHEINERIEEDEIASIPNTFDEPVKSVAEEIQGSKDVTLRHSKKIHKLRKQEERDEDED
ncbi:MAG: hypothetical protein M1816_006280 [Peltula sp. TS41687]|nr:MAG: hypothetical protein M1816_006280 [Peltula sp. TS41687]